MNIEKMDFASNTSFMGEVSTTYDSLVKAFGEPNMGPNDDICGKVTCEWMLKIDGVVCTIYDWKTESTPMGNYNWHVGGYDNDAHIKVYEVLNK